MGKTSLLVTILLNVARAGGRVGLFTMEMGREQIIQRIFSTETSIDLQKLRVGQIGQQEWSKIVNSTERLIDHRVYIDARASLSPDDVMARAMRWKQEHGLDLLMLDYIGLMSDKRARHNGNRVQEVGYFSRECKRVASELNVPFIVASQLSRAVENRQDKRPVMSDLRDSGDLEQDADIVTFLYREDYYDDYAPSPGLTELIVAKHRNGPTGTVNAYFDRRATKFSDAQLRTVSLNGGAP
jgi:replicative DNA helicase